MAAELFAEGALDFSETREEVLRARHLPGRFYTSQEILDLEIERIFMKDWLCVGRVEQYENPGDYRAFRIAGEPVLICRARDGSLNAFANVCAHRGVEIIQGNGNAEQFVCPYHAWTYGIDGRLKTAPHNREVQGFDWKKCGLPKLQLDSWAGYLFINFDPSAASLREFLTPERIEACAFLRAEDTRVASEFTLEVPCNWKFVPENVADMYHVAVVHGDSFGKDFKLSDFNWELDERGYYAEYRCMTHSPGGAWLFGKAMPWLEGAPELFAWTAFSPPNLTQFARPDTLQNLIAYPLAPDRTLVTVMTQYPAEWFDEPGFSERVQINEDFLKLILAEDNGMLRSLQNGVGSRHFRPGPTMGPEKGIHHLLNNYLDRMFGEGSTQTT